MKKEDVSIHILQDLPKKVGKKIIAMDLDRKANRDIADTYSTLVLYENMKLIEYYENLEENMQYKPVEDINTRIEKYRSQYKLLEPFISVEGGSPSFEIRNPSSVLKDLEDNLESLGYEKVKKILLILTGKKKKPRRSDHEKLTRHISRISNIPKLLQNLRNIKKLQK